MFILLSGGVLWFLKMSMWKFGAGGRVGKPVGVGSFMAEPSECVYSQAIR